MWRRILLLGGLAACDSREGSSRPLHGAATGASLVLVTLDTTRADRLGPYGAAHARTPTLDRVASEGVVFEYALSPAPVTLPAHASLFTGQLPLEHGVRDNGVHVLAPGAATLAEALEARGYRTAAFVSACVLGRDFGLAQGFSSYDDLMDSSDPAVLEPIERRATATVDAALAWVQQGLPEPWFLWLHFFDAHYPYAAPPAFAAGAATPYDGEIAYMDAELGRFLEAYGAEGRLDRTLLVITADHGEGLMDHDEQTHGLFVYSSTVHVPLLLRFPPLGAARRIPGAVSLVDVAGTVLDLLGVPAPEGGGRGSLVPALASGAAQPRDVYLETQLPLFSYGLAPLAAIVSGGWKYVEAPRPELYALEDDPRELHDRIAAEPEQAQLLAGRLEALRAAAGSPAPALPGSLSPEVREHLASLGYLEARSEQFAGKDPKDALRWIQGQAYALHLLEQGNLEEAGPLLEKVLEECPDNATAMTYLAEIRLQRDDLDGAIRLLERARTLRPDMALALFSLGQAYARKDDVARASAAFEELLRRFPTMGKAYVAASRMLFEHGDVPGALGVLERALRSVPEDDAVRAQIEQNHARLARMVQE